MRDLIRGFWKRWKELASFVGDFQARMLLTVFYFTVAAPFAAIVRSIDPLQMRRRARSSRWLPREIESASLETARRQS